MQYKGKKREVWFREHSVEINGTFPVETEIFLGGI
jgi:hypothetical protein